MKIFSTIVVIGIGIGILYYIVQYGVSIHAVPSFGEFVASSTVKVSIDTTASSTTTVADNSLPQIPFYAPDATINVYVAKTPLTRDHGLSGWTALNEDEGMLFIFPNSGNFSFWMKEMLFPIDIVWMDSNKKVIVISENVSPESYPNTFSPTSPAQFVLEVNAGNASKAGLQIGKVVSF